VHTLSKIDGVDLQPAKDMRQNPLCRQILTYWLEHPAAKDSADGVRMWWLSGTSKCPEDLTFEKVRNALQLLVTTGLAMARGHGERDTIYTLNRSDIEAIGQLVQEWKDGGPGE
jgi:hypothetical protein